MSSSLSPTPGPQSRGSTTSTTGDSYLAPHSRMTIFRNFAEWVYTRMTNDKMGIVCHGVDRVEMIDLTIHKCADRAATFRQIMQNDCALGKLMAYAVLDHNDACEEYADDNRV